MMRRIYFPSDPNTPSVPDPVRYAPLERGDVPYLLKMTRENMSQVILSSWGLEWRDETLLEELLDSHLFTEIAKSGDNPVGYYSIDRRGDYAFIISLQVTREFQGYGLGKEMMQRIEDWASQSGMEGVELCVQSTNDQAIGFYEHIGYDRVSRERNNIVMRKVLKQPTKGE